MYTIGTCTLFTLHTCTFVNYVRPSNIVNCTHIVFLDILSFLFVHSTDNLIRFRFVRYTGVRAAV